MAAYPPSGFFDVGTFAEAFDRVGQAAREASYSLRDGLAESFREVGRAMSGLTSFLEGRRRRRRGDSLLGEGTLRIGDIDVPVHNTTISFPPTETTFSAPVGDVEAAMKKRREEEIKEAEEKGVRMLRL